MIANISTRLQTDDTTGSIAFWTIVETQPQSLVTRRIESPTDLR